MAYQRAYFPTKTISLSQGYGLLSSTHKYSYALDLAGTYEPFAPFDCEVTKVYKPTNTLKSREVWLTSTKKVLCANGYYGYLTMSITHPAGIYKMKVGDKFKQFQSLGITTANMTGTSTGPHCHIELSQGKEAGWDANIIKKHDAYVNVNKIKPEEYLFIVSDAVVKKDTYKLKKYNFIKEADITYKVKGVPSEPLYIRSDKYPKGKVIGKLYNGNEVLKFDNNKYCLVYHYEVLGYTSKKYLKK